MRHLTRVQVRIGRVRIYPGNRAQDLFEHATRSNLAAVSLSQSSLRVNCQTRAGD